MVRSSSPMTSQKTGSAPRRRAALAPGDEGQRGHRDLVALAQLERGVGELERGRSARAGDRVASADVGRPSASSNSRTRGPLESQPDSSAPRAASTAAAGSRTSERGTIQRSVPGSGGAAGGSSSVGDTSSVARSSLIPRRRPGGSARGCARSSPPSARAPRGATPRASHPSCSCAAEASQTSRCTSLASGRTRCSSSSTSSSRPTTSPATRTSSADGHPLPGSDVEQAPRRPVPGGEGEQPRHGVLDVQEVAHRVERSERRARRPASAWVEDRGDDRARRLARPVGVEWPHDPDRRSERAMEAERELVGGDLRGRVRRLGVEADRAP